MKQDSGDKLGEDLRKLSEEKVKKLTLDNLIIVSEIGHDISNAAKQMLNILLDLNKLSLNNDARMRAENASRAKVLMAQLQKNSIKFETNLEQASYSFNEATKLAHIFGERAVKTNIIYSREYLLNLKDLSAKFDYDCAHFPTEVLKVSSDYVLCQHLPNIFSF